MSGKVKMRCARCGKSFKSANARQNLCPDCEQKERAARATGKSAAAKPAAPVAVVKPKIVGAGAHILDPNAPLPPPEVPAAAHEDHPRTAHGAHDHHPRAAAGTSTHHGKPAARHAQPAEAQPAVAAARHSPKAKKEPPHPFQLSDEQRATVEARYLELAQPVEFDGIRGQIATELGIPKSAVKRAILELRRSMQLPSWWELQAFVGTPEDLERIRAAYVPLLPIPEVGAHRQLAERLGLDPAAVYQGIRRIRAEMRLPQYNPPEAHGMPAQTAAAQAAPTPEAPGVVETA